MRGKKNTKTTEAMFNFFFSQFSLLAIISELKMYTSHLS